MNDKELNLKVNGLKSRFTEADLQKINKSVNEIFDVIRQNGKYKIDRCRVVGGLGKKTSTYPPDADLAVFYNGEYNDVEKTKMIQDFQELLVKKLSSVNNFKKTRNDVLQFKYGNLDVDLVLAQNLAMNSKGDVVKVQTKNAFDKYHLSDMSVVDLSMLVTEGSLKLMKSTTSFVHDVVLLCKDWNGEQEYEGYVYGRSLIMETLAILAAVEEEDAFKRSHLGDGQPSIKKAFLRFLDSVSKLKRGRFMLTKAAYDKSDIPPGVLSQTPLLLDPVNPYNNLLSNVPPKFFDEFEEAALKSLSRYS